MNRNEIRVTVAVETPTRYANPDELYSKSVVLSEELAGLSDVREAVARSTVKMIDEALASFTTPDASEAVTGGTVIMWLAEEDRLRWAIARVRGHQDGPTHEDEEEASELLVQLRSTAEADPDAALEALPF